MNVMKPKSMLMESEKDHALYSVIQDKNDLITCIFQILRGRKEGCTCWGMPTDMSELETLLKTQGPSGHTAGISAIRSR